MAKNFTKELLTEARYELYKHNSEVIQFWRNNPVIAAKDLLGIRNFDFQKYIIQNSFSASRCLWLMSRNASKTFTGAELIMLKQLLYEDQSIFIIAPTGRQSKNLFQNMEKIANDSIPTIRGLKDIYLDELYKAHSHLTGFKHDPSGFSSKILNGSEVMTINGNIDGARGGRSSLLVFDECGFNSSESLGVIEAFGTTNANLQTSADDLFNSAILKDKVPKQFLYMSSASDTTTEFYNKFRNYSKRMLLGDSNYFVAQIDVNIPLNPTMDGKDFTPLLDKSLPEDMERTNPRKHAREFMCIFDSDGGEDQIIKGSTITRNETFVLPELSPDGKSKYIFAQDAAYNHDNAIMGVMKLCHDEKIGYYGEIINMIHFYEYGNKFGRQMLPPQQIELFREHVKTYNGNSPQYEKIDQIMIDLGAGGAGNSLWLPTLLYDWTAKDGSSMRGMIDNEYHSDKTEDFPNAMNIVTGVSPQKYRNDMVGEFIELMDLGLIKFPKPYNNSGSVQYEDSEGELVNKKLSLEEEMALVNIDIAKEETKMIHKFTDLKTRRVSYNLRSDMKNKMHDDRWYVLCLLAHRLHQIRRDDEDNKYKTDSTSGYDYVFS